jgi:hypothetical protein
MSTPWENERDVTVTCENCDTVQDTVAVRRGGWWEFGDCEECDVDLTPEDPRIP